ncbi:MAG: sulfite exporter TauE/SafE family protein [Bryobacterales bacterium]
MLLLRFITYMALCAVPLAALQGDGHDAVRERLEALLRVSDPTAGFLAVALGVAFLAGAAHALTPGHGKALVAAYLAGSKGTVWDAVYLGTVVTITHTASVFVLGLATLYASQHIQMEKIYAWLSIFSGLLIVVIGGSMLWSRWRALRAGGEQQAHDHSHGHSHGFFGWLTHSHSHEHGHSHSHGHVHSHEHGHEHGHADGHEHSHENGHEHSHADGHSHSHEHSHENTAVDHGHSHGPGHSHTHEGHAHDHGHSHTHPAAAKAGRGSLLTLGISGGLVPCPEAMVVLLISITINRLLFGIVILIAFSLGLAAILIAIGIAMVLAGPTLNRFTKDGPLLRALPVGSAALVTLLGVAILFSAVNDAGMLKF